MLGRVVHIGVTVSDIERSIEFYRDTLGLNFQGRMVMEGESTDKLFNIKDCRVEVAYLNGSDKLNTPTIELLEINKREETEEEIKLNKLSISEICFTVNNIDEIYKDLKEEGVEFLSPPQYFDLKDQGFGESKAVYFKDPDGIILELIENI